MPVPVSVLDLAPIPSGSTISGALADTVDLARSTELLGYRRYWLAEHHLNPGVAGAVPTLLIQAVAAATGRIRVGSGAVQTGHRTALSVVEELGTLDALFPGRIDLGLGRSGGPKPPSRASGHTDRRVVDEVIGLIAGTHRTADGIEVHATPGEAAGVQTWVLGSSGGESADVAGARGLPFAANYHVSPGTVVDAVQGYRAAFPAVADAVETVCDGLRRRRRRAR